jgi:hypothetical protein
MTDALDRLRELVLSRGKMGEHDWEETADALAEVEQLWCRTSGRWNESAAAPFGEDIWCAINDGTVRRMWRDPDGNFCERDGYMLALPPAVLGWLPLDALPPAPKGGSDG